MSTIQACTHYLWTWVVLVTEPASWRISYLTTFGKVSPLELGDKKTIPEKNGCETIAKELLF